MVGEVFIELWGGCSDFAEVVPWGVREIMVLDVVSKVEVEEIPNAYVIVGLLSLDELVVLSNDVDGSRVRAD